KVYVEMVNEIALNRENDYENATRQSLLNENKSEKKDIYKKFTAPKKIGLTKKLIFSLASAVIGSAFQFGYNTGVINAPGELIRQFINESHISRYGSELSASTVGSLLAFTVAVFAVGGCIGGLLNGFCADFFGRKKSLLLNNLLGILGALFMGFSKYANSYEMIIIGRFIIGLNCGLNSGLCPMYLNELSPVDIRGSVGALFQLGVTSTIMLSQILGLPEILGTEDLWPLLLGITGLFSIIQLLTLPFCPESPRFLLINKDLPAEAETALMALRGTKDIKHEIDDMKNEAEMQRSQPKFTIFSLFSTRALLLPTVISIVLHLSQQLSGINAVFYYSNDILNKSGIENSQYATPFIGLIMVIMTLVSIPLMEKSGRRFLHLLGLGGMFVFSIFMTIAFVLQSKYDWLKYLSIVSMMLFIVFFAIGPGSIPWMMVAELFSQGPRSAAVSLAVLVNWSANVAVGQGFPPLFENVTKNWTFLLFAVFLAVFWVFTFAFLPETKNKKAEEITAYFQDKKNLFAFKANTNLSDAVEDFNI
ncbi:glucose transporter type 1 isoform X5, partial [Brachionus plicatilis]